MIRFLLGVAGTIGTIVLCCAMENFPAYYLLVLTPSLIVLCVPIFATWAAYPLGAWGLAWKDALGQRGPGRNSIRSAEIWDFQEKASYASAIVGFIVGLIFVLRNLTEPEKLGAHVAVCLVSLIYGALLGLFYRILRARCLVRGD